VTNGTDAYRTAVDAALSTARLAARMVESSPYLELVREPELSVVLFRRKGWGLADYYNWSAKLLDEQVAFVTPTKWEGETVARLIFLHPGTTEEIVREVIATMA
jgi:glutamate/tyrosine decarboxylase-like PLP-dependent enzyme